MHTVSFWNTYRQSQSQKMWKPKSRTPLKTWGELNCSGRVSSSWTTYTFILQNKSTTTTPKRRQYNVQSIFVVGTTRPWTSGTSNWHLVLQGYMSYYNQSFFLLLPYDFDVSTPYLYRIYCGDDIRVKLLYIMDIINLKVFSS